MIRQENVTSKKNVIGFYSFNCVQRRTL